MFGQNGGIREKASLRSRLARPSYARSLNAKGVIKQVEGLVKERPDPSTTGKGVDNQKTMGWGVRMSCAVHFQVLL